ncbi:MAG: hypothetical protein K6E18_02275 [Lachnospiraceae bacterium]|nr:hypothetical protein [Lachnospiraceae bacterium]
MDNFMDRLSGRFHAGELIQANREAEARQMQKLKEQNDEQTQVLSEIRRLNLKTVEISEQVSQMAALSIERLEEFEEVFKNAAKAEEKEQNLNAENAIDGGTGWELEMYQGMSQLHTELQNVESLESSLLAFQENQTEHNARLASLMQDFLDNQNKPTSWQTEVWQSMSLMQQQLQNLEQSAGSQMSVQEQMQSTYVEFTQKMESQYEAIAEKMDANLGKDVKPNFVYEIEASLSEIENNAVRGRQETWTKMDQLRDALSEGSTDKILTQLSELLKEDGRQSAETLSQIKELVVGLRVYLDEVEKKVEDFVHKEDVKVYRNVQAAVMETVSARNRDVLERLDHIEKRTDKQKGLKALMVLTCLFSLASLAITVLQMLGIL